MDVDGVTEDSVTYQAIRSYLKDHRGAEYTPDERDPIERELDNVQQLQGRIDSVTEGKLLQLRNSDELTLGDFRTIVTVQVYCEDCTTQITVEELLTQGGCNCTCQSAGDATHRIYYIGGTKSVYMCTQQESGGAEIIVTNVDGIDEASVSFTPGVTILEGENATNRTSLL